MKQLFFSEFNRYKKLTALFFIVVLMIFVYVTSDRSPFPPSWKYEFLNYIPNVLAAVFGLVQMYLHKRANHWTYLIHRPLSPRKIFLAVIGAGMTIVFIVLALPFLLVTLYQDVFTFQNIDFRDYVHIFTCLLRYYVFYLISCLVMLNASKGTALIYISCFVLLFFAPANQLAQFLPVSISIAVLLYLNAISFKPDVKSYPDKPVGVILQSACMMIGAFMVVAFFTVLTHEIANTVINGKAEPSASKGTMRYFSLLTKPEDQLAYALEGSGHPSKDHYINQAEIADSFTLANLGFKFPFRGQTFHTSGQTGASIRHTQTNTVWHFSHDSMLVEGRNLGTNELAGSFGVRGYLAPGEPVTEQDRFLKVPVLQGGRHLMTSDALYHVDLEELIFETKYQLEAGEHFAERVIQRPPFSALLTNQRLLLFDRQEFNSESPNITPEYSVPLPVKHQNFTDIQIYELVDGYLLQFKGMNFYGPGQPGVEVFHARLNGEVELIGARAFTEFYVPAWRRQLENILGPALYYLTLSYQGWVTAEPQELRQRFQSLSVYGYMVVIQIFSFIAVFLLCRRHGLSRVLTMTWAGLTAVFGFPALICFFLLNPWMPLKRLLAVKQSGAGSSGLGRSDQGQSGIEQRGVRSRLQSV